MIEILIFMHRGGESAVRRMEVQYSVQNVLAVFKADGWTIDRYEVL